MTTSSPHLQGQPVETYESLNHFALRYNSFDSNNGDFSAVVNEVLLENMTNHITFRET